MTTRACCCDGSDICCEDVPWVVSSSAAPTKYYRISIPVSFENKYGFKVDLDNIRPGACTCEAGGGCNGASADIVTDTTAHGDWAGLADLAIHKCGSSTGCHNGEAIPGTIPVEYVPGSCGNGGGPMPYTSCALGNCFPYNWFPYCCTPETGGTGTCGDVSALALAKIRDQVAGGVAKFTLLSTKNWSNWPPLSGCNPSNGFNCGGGQPGFEQVTAPTSVIPSTWNYNTTENQEWRWSSGGGCGDGWVGCGDLDLQFFCVNAIRAYGSGQYQYFTPQGPKTAAPSSSSIPYISLADYADQWVATLRIVHGMATQDELVRDRGWGQCGVLEEEQDASLTYTDIGFIGACGPLGVSFSSFGGTAACTTSGDNCLPVSAGGFGVSFNLDKWES